MRQYQTFELTFEGPALEKNWASVDVKAVFTNGEKTIEAKGFYDGEAGGKGIYKVRMFPETAGEWKWTVSGAVSGCGSEICEEAAKEGNSSVRHGMVKAVDRHFEYSDGTVFHPFGTTVYALIHQDPKTLEQTMATLSEGYFNKVRMCVFPKHYNYNHNEPELYAFEKMDPEGGIKDNWDVSRPCIAFWQYLEALILRLQEMDVQVDLILFHPYDRWGFSELSQGDNLKYLEYLTARLSAIPNIWWSLANEYDLAMKTKTLEDWEEIECCVADHDPAKHLLSNHNCFKTWDYSRKNVTHVSIQSKDFNNIPRLREKYQKPAVLDECCYEGNIEEIWGCISGKEMTSRFWRMVASGCYCTHGETFYDPEDILWWARGGVLKGESPKRIRFLKNLMEELPPLDPVPGRMEPVVMMSAEQAKAMESHMPPEFRGFFQAIFRMDETERSSFLDSEHQWQGKSRDNSVFMYYLNLYTCAVMHIDLPQDRTYRVEIIDTWNMTRKTVLTGVNGNVKVELPGEEFYTILAVAE